MNLAWIAKAFSYQLMALNKEDEVSANFVQFLVPVIVIYA